MANFNYFTSDSFQEKFYSLFHSLQQGIVFQNRDGNIISANSAACDILGLTEDELLGRTSMNPEWRSMKEDGTPFEGKDHPAMVALRTGKPVKEVIMGVYHPRKKAIKWISIDAHPEFMEAENEPFRVFAVFTDITEKFEAVQKLRESSERLERYFNSVPVGIFVVDRSGFYIDVNPTGCLLYDDVKEEIIGTHISKYVAEESSELGVYAFEALIEKGSFLGEIVLKTTKESKFTAMLSTIKLSESEFIGYVTDISDFRKARQELKIAKEKAEEANRLKSNILSNMSHELRTPIHGIVGLSEMIFDEAEEPMIKETAQILIAAGSRLMNTFNLILDVSIQDAKEITEGYSEFDLVELVRNTGEEFRGLAQKKGIEYTISLPDGSMQSTLPHASVETALKCLLDNAIKYTFAGSVELKLLPPAGENENVRIEVVDTGIGVSDEHHEIIFEDFRQVSEGLGRSFEGTGLGLTLARKIVRNLGGDIKIESTEGSGSLFIIELPGSILEPERRQNYSRLKPDFDDEPAVTNGHPNVLVLEKDRMSGSILKVSIRDDYNVKLADDEEHVIKLLKSEKFDVVLLSVLREEIQQSMELVAGIKRQPGYEGVPVLGMFVPTPGEPGINPGDQLFDSVLHKPFFKKDLLEALAGVLGRKGGRI